MVTMDASRRVIEDGAIAIRGPRIEAVGSRTDLEPCYPDARRIDAPDGLITPGLIDAHNHPIHYLSKGLADDLELSHRSYERIWPLRGGAHRRGGLRQRARDLRRDDPPRHDVLLRPGQLPPRLGGPRRPGDRHPRHRHPRELGRRPTNCAARPPESTTDALERGEEVVERWNGAGAGRLRGWFSLVRPSHVTDELCRRTMERAEALGVGIHGHLTASRTADVQTRRVVGHGSAVDRYRELGLLRRNLCLAHLGWIEPDEVAAPRRRRRQGGSLPVGEHARGLRGHRARHVPRDGRGRPDHRAGSDAGAISRFLDLVRVMYLAACAHKDARIDPTAMGADTAFEMATIGRAARFSGSDRIGSLESGRRPIWSSSTRVASSGIPTRCTTRWPTSSTRPVDALRER